MCRLDSRHTVDIMKGLLPFSVTDPKRGMPGTPVGQSNGLGRATGTGTHQSKLMTATASTIANAKALIAPARGGIGTASSGFPWRNGFLGRKRRRLAYLALLVAGIYAAAAEEGQVTRPNEPMEFHIPSQPLATALQAYGQRTGVQVLYESNSAIGRMSAAVEGNLAPDAALNLLLTGTDLRVRYARPDAITLALPYTEDIAPPPASSLLDGADLSLGTLRVRGSRDGDEVARLSEYSERVQLDVQNALRKNTKTRDGSYRAVLDLWIDPARTIERTELFRSTGDRERDDAIATTLRGVMIGRPAPANAPRPVRVSIVVQSLQ